MVNYCPNCGWRVLDPNTVTCGGCGDSLPGHRRQGLISRLVAWLSRPSNRPVVAARREHIVVSQRTKFSWTDPATGQQRTSSKIEDLPPAIRAEVEKLRSDGPPSGSRYTFRDATGEHTYNSLEEMPPEVRRLFERASKPT